MGQTKFASPSFEVFARRVLGRRNGVNPRTHGVLCAVLCFITAFLVAYGILDDNQTPLMGGIVAGLGAAGVGDRLRRETSESDHGREK